MPRQPSTGELAPVDRQAARRSLAAGSGESSFVRGSRARYIHSLGRWRSGSSPPPKRSAHSTSPPIEPTASPAPMPRLPHADPVLALRARSGDRQLRRARSLGLKEREPERAGRSGAGPLVDRVADPGAERLRRDGTASGRSSRSGPPFRAPRQSARRWGRPPSRTRHARTAPCPKTPFSSSLAPAPVSAPPPPGARSSSATG